MRSQDGSGSDLEGYADPKIRPDHGVAQVDISAGEWVHERNIAFDSFERDYAIASEARPLQALLSDELAEFQGYRRSTGKVGTRNYLGILTSVNCSATVARLIAREAERLDLLAEYPQVDAIIPLVHGTGCAIRPRRCVHPREGPRDFPEDPYRCIGRTKQVGAQRLRGHGIRAMANRRSIVVITTNQLMSKDVCPSTA